MDVGISSNGRQRRSLAAQLFGVLILATLLGCLSAQPPELTLPEKDSLAQLKKSVEELRGLAAKRDYGFESPAMDAAKAAAAQFGPVSIAQLERAYKQSGLIASHVDFEKALAEYLRLESLIAYDRAREQIGVSTDALKLSATLDAKYARAAAEVPLSIGIVLALQEQHFQWQDKLRTADLEDRRLAYRAISLGDAVLAALAHASDRNTFSLSDLDATARMAARLENLAASLPDVLRWKLGFPYREGSQFVAWALKARGWSGVNSLLVNPPASTAQILHPEKYFLKPAAPQRFFAPALLARMPGPAVVEQNFGEFLIRGLLATENTAKFASEIAAAWRGDQLFSFQDGAISLTAWFSSWESDQDAARFQRAYQPVLEARLRIRLRRDGEKGDDWLSAVTSDRGAFALQRRGSVVLYLSGPADRAIATADEAWKDLEIDSESMALGFESASSVRRKTARTSRASTRTVTVQ